jgi:hypothetical protein
MSGTRHFLAKTTNKTISNTAIESGAAHVENRSNTMQSSRMITSKVQRKRSSPSFASSSDTLASSLALLSFAGVDGDPPSICPKSLSVTRFGPIFVLLENITGWDHSPKYTLLIVFSPCSPGPMGHRNKLSGALFRQMIARLGKEVSLWRSFRKLGIKKYVPDWRIPKNLNSMIKTGKDRAKIPRLKWFIDQKSSICATDIDHMSDI